MSYYITDTPIIDDGEYVLTYPNGKIHIKMTIKDGLLHGARYEYNFKGILVSETNYKEGNIHGIVKIYYPNGKKFIVKHYRKNKLNGYYTQYDKTGEKIYKLVYNNNKIVKEY